MNGFINLHLYGRQKDLMGFLALQKGRSHSLCVNLCCNWIFELMHVKVKLKLTHRSRASLFISGGVFVLFCKIMVMVTSWFCLFLKSFWQKTMPGSRFLNLFYKSN